MKARILYAIKINVWILKTKNMKVWILQIIEVKVSHADQMVSVWLQMFLFGHRTTEMKQIHSECSHGPERRAAHFQPHAGVNNKVTPTNKRKVRCASVTMSPSMEVLNLKRLQ